MRHVGLMAASSSAGEGLRYLRWSIMTFSGLQLALSPHGLRRQPVVLPRKSPHLCRRSEWRSRQCLRPTVSRRIQSGGCCAGVLVVIPLLTLRWGLENKNRKQKPAREGCGCHAHSKGSALPRYLEPAKDEAAFATFHSVHVPCLHAALPSPHPGQTCAIRKKPFTTIETAPDMHRAS
eukprot:scaffold1948_cov244-Pinguiococcus_pyrenoidosus.AAC.3